MPYQTLTKIDYDRRRTQAVGMANQMDAVGDRYLSAIKKHRQPQKKVKKFIDHQSYTSIRRKFHAEKKLFVDRTFKPSSKLLVHSDRDQNIKWMRPKDISPTGKPIFFNEGIAEKDMMQGRAGDCWILAACSTLIQHPGLFYRVVPPDQSFDHDTYSGVFHFRLWHQQCWYDVVIDDLLPYDMRTKQLRYARSANENEFWSALLEKAFAKVFGSYEAIGRGGLVSRTLTGITGGACYTYYLSNGGAELGRMAEALTITLSNGHLACAASKRQDEKPNNGLGNGHGYSVKNVAWVNSNGDDIFLVSLRNPWGTKEWNGKWSDKDEESWDTISKDYKDALYEDVDDGVFWMEWDDFVANFNQVSVCHLSVDIFHDIYLVTKETHNFKRCWTKTEFKLMKSHIVAGLDLDLSESVPSESILVISVHKRCPLHGLQSVPVQGNIIPTFFLNEGSSNDEGKRYKKFDTYNRSDISLTIRFIAEPKIYSLDFDAEFAQSKEYYISIMTEVPLVISCKGRRVAASPNILLPSMPKVTGETPALPPGMMIQSTQSPAASTHLGLGASQAGWNKVDIYKTFLDETEISHSDSESDLENVEYEIAEAATSRQRNLSAPRDVVSHERNQPAPRLLCRRSRRNSEASDFVRYRSGGRRRYSGRRKK